MAIKSTYTANLTVDTNLAGTYLALFSDDPTPAGTGTELALTRQLLSFPSAVNGIAQNDTQVNFANVPTGVITHWGLYDAESAGNMIYYGKFVNAINFTESGGQLTFEINDISIREE